MFDQDDQQIEAALQAAVEALLSAEVAEEAARKAEVNAAAKRTLDSQSRARAVRADAELARQQAQAAEARAVALVGARDIKAADAARVLAGETTIDVDPDGVAHINYSTLPPGAQAWIREHPLNRRAAQED